MIEPPLQMPYVQYRLTPKYLMPSSLSPSRLFHPSAAPVLSLSRNCAPPVATSSPVATPVALVVCSAVRDLVNHARRAQLLPRPQRWLSGSLASGSPPLARRRPNLPIATALKVELHLLGEWLADPVSLFLTLPHPHPLPLPLPHRSILVGLLPQRQRR